MAKGVTAGAVFVFLMAGPATNASSIAVVKNILGRRTMAHYLFLISSTAIVFGFILDSFLTIVPPAMSSNTHVHADDSYMSLFLTILFVLILVNAYFYTLKGELNKDDSLSWGQAAILRSGSDFTLITYSRMVHRALEAAERLTKLGIQAEVIDLRTLYPLDTETINSSVKKTGRALVVTEDCLTAGVSAELSARIMEGAFEFLEEPVLRLAGEDIPIPVSPSLEKEAVPSVDRIFSTAKLLLRK